MKKHPNPEAHDRPHSLFVGRWQPFHKGHKKLIETVLKKGKSVVVAIRDTEVSHGNPYSVNERWNMIQKVLHRYGNLVKIIVIPDIDEICYGRDVGYAIRQIDLDAQTHKISGTKTREKLKPTKLIVWLTGNTGSGKTTIGTLLSRELGAILLDGDEMRESVSIGAGFSKEDREAHNLRVARLAKVLSKRQPVVVAVIAPFASTREKIDRIAKPVWVYVKRALKKDAKKPYEVPTHPHITIDNDKHTPEANTSAILTYIVKTDVPQDTYPRHHAVD